MPDPGAEREQIVALIAHTLYDRRPLRAATLAEGVREQAAAILNALSDVLVPRSELERAETTAERYRQALEGATSAIWMASNRATMPGGRFVTVNFTKTEWAVLKDAERRAREALRHQPEGEER